MFSNTFSFSRPGRINDMISIQDISVVLAFCLYDTDIDTDKQTGDAIWNISISRRLFCGPTLTLTVGVHLSVLAITGERDMFCHVGSRASIIIIIL